MDAKSRSRIALKGKQVRECVGSILDMPILWKEACTNAHIYWAGERPHGEDGGKYEVLKLKKVSAGCFAICGGNGSLHCVDNPGNGGTLLVLITYDYFFSERILLESPMLVYDGVLFLPELGHIPVEQR